MLKLWIGNCLWIFMAGLDSEVMKWGNVTHCNVGSLRSVERSHTLTRSSASPLPLHIGFKFSSTSVLCNLKSIWVFSHGLHIFDLFDLFVLSAWECSCKSDLRLASTTNSPMDLPWSSLTASSCCLVPLLSGSSAGTSTLEHTAAQNRGSQKAWQCFLSVHVDHVHGPFFWQWIWKILKDPGKWQGQRPNSLCLHITWYPLNAPMWTAQQKRQDTSVMSSFAGNTCDVTTLGECKRLKKGSSPVFPLLTDTVSLLCHCRVSALPHDGCFKGRWNLERSYLFLSWRVVLGCTDWSQMGNSAAAVQSGILVRSRVS